MTPPRTSSQRSPRDLWRTVRVFLSVTLKACHIVVAPKFMVIAHRIRNSWYRNRTTVGEIAFDFRSLAPSGNENERIPHLSLYLPYSIIDRRSHSFVSQFCFKVVGYYFSNRPECSWTCLRGGVLCHVALSSEMVSFCITAPGVYCKCINYGFTHDCMALKV